MLRNISLVVLLAIIATGQCEDIENILPQVTGGINTVPGEAPSVVSIRVPTNVGGDTTTYCSGTILNENHVLTSAVCVHNDNFLLINPFWFRIIAGDLNIVQPSYRRFTTNATHIYTHPDYTFNPRRNDLAVIRTSQPFPFPHNTIDFAIRNQRVLPNAQDCRFVGWGASTTATAINAVQQRVNAPIIDRNACMAPNVHGPQIEEYHVCAGSLTATNPISGVCVGNVGGPLFCNVNNWWELHGVLSFGHTGCGAANHPGVYTQVRFFDQWINQQLTRTDATPPGIPVVVP